MHVDNWHHPSKENKQVIVNRCTVDTHDNGERSSPTSIEKGKSSPHISTYFCCNSMDTSSTTSVEENHVIKQNVKMHSGDTPNISCILPKDEKTNTDEAALEISGKSAAHNLQSRENGILHPSAETHCANILEEDSAFKETLAVGLDQSSVDTSVRAAQSSSPVWSQKRNASHQNRAKSKVEVQECVAEGLPEGWTKEIKVTKKNGNVKKDPYYTDPMSGFIFRSMKDVLRHLKPEILGGLHLRERTKVAVILSWKMRKHLHL